MEEEFNDLQKLEQDATTQIENIRLELEQIGEVEDQEERSAQLNRVGRKITECKGLIREFEREARAEDMERGELSERKRKLVKKLNHVLTRKKVLQQELNERDSLLAPVGTSVTDTAAANGAGTSAALAAGSSGNGTSALQVTPEEVSTTQLMAEGRSLMKDDEDTLLRSKKLVEETVTVGTETAVTVKKQTEQIDRIVTDLDEIHFSLKKAGALIRDITRAIATDKCIMVLMMLVAIGVLGIIVYNIVKTDDSSDSNAAGQTSSFGLSSCLLLVIFLLQALLV
mmetsp:Transcript_1088/g.7015  ORF Transcript_1088/g.7015 Transcript_1088/m.7015 type:complete len:284 (-) Transcript_1088:1429-2280(-)